ncbi:hypothetical protein FHS78_003564 [Parvibaculum indicum]|uniref:hypothetical protein n=1 Tax=Parvibaculum indicum TaxID=562969 RepID=UPI0014232E58|nr:hypothetical protein [Parvibaculum indicum]NIJ43252.1 hypothetical protein [Parvibaculum indicum]
MGKHQDSLVRTSHLVPQLMCYNSKMRHGKLRSIAHNIATSLTSDASLLFGVGGEIYDGIEGKPEGYIIVDFLTGTSSGARPSLGADGRICAAPAILNELCRKHGTSIWFFKELTARYVGSGTNAYFTVTVEDRMGKRTVEEFHRFGHRVRIVDSLGRIRPKPPKRSSTTPNK